MYEWSFGCNKRSEFVLIFSTMMERIAVLFTCHMHREMGMDGILYVSHKIGDFKMRRTNRVPAFIGGMMVAVLVAYGSAMHS